MLSFGYAKTFPIKRPINFHEWVRNQFGEKLFSIFFKTYTEKVWGMSCDEISADWAAQRIKGLDLGVAVLTALKRLMLPKRKSKKSGGKVVKTLIENFQYPRKGPGMMWEAAANKTAERGGRILMGRKLVNLTYDSARAAWIVEVVTQSGERETYSARDVVSSAPIRELIERIEPAPETLSRALMLRYRDFLIVALIVNKPYLFPDNWIYIHDPSVKVGRVQNFQSWSPEMVQSGMSCLGLEYFCFEGDGLWNAPDSELIALAKAEIAKIGIIEAEDVVDACVVRQPKAYPVYDGDYRQHVDAIRGELDTKFPTLHLIGRNGMHKYNNQDHAMMTGILTAKNILAKQKIYDVWNVNEDAEYHEAGSTSVNQGVLSERQVPRRVAAATTPS